MPTDSNYLAAELELLITQPNADLVVRFSRPQSASRKRLRDVLITGIIGDSTPPSKPPNPNGDSAEYDFPQVNILPNDTPGADPDKPNRVIWSTEPGIRYQLESSQDLLGWQIVDGFPSQAEALAQQHAFQRADSGKRFFRVGVLDEQAPVITYLSPSEGAYGIGRFRAIEIELADRTGIDPNSISMSIGNSGAINLDHPALSLEDEILIYDMEGDVALGNYGEIIEVSLNVADVLGNAARYDWSFELEKELVEAPDLFIFGSLQAQAIGQRVANIPTRAVAQRYGGLAGPRRMNDASEWELAAVGDDFVRISYTGDVPPTFVVGQPIANLTPESVDEIFYRLITGVSNDAGGKLLTLATEEADFWEILTDGSFSINDDVLVFDVDEDGRILSGTQIPARGGTLELPAIVFDWSDRKVMGTYRDASNQDQIQWGLNLENPPGGGSWDSTLTLNNARISVTPILTLEANMRPVRFRAETALRMNPQVEATWNFLHSQGSMRFEAKNTLWSVRKVLWIPKTLLWVDVNPKVDVKTKFDAGLVGTVRCGARSTFTISEVIDYDAGRTPQVIYGPQFRSPSISFDWPPTAQIGGTIGASVALVPEIDVLFNSLAGFYVNMDPSVGIRGTATVVGNEAGTANLTIYSKANLNAGVKVGKKTRGWLPTMTPFKLFEIDRSWIYPTPATTEPLMFVLQPQSVSVTHGAAFSLEAQVNRSSGVSYEWFKDGVSQGVFSDNLFARSNAKAWDAGSYQVLARSGGQSVMSNAVTVQVLPLGVNGGHDMVTVQGGTLAMSMGTRTVNTFQIGRYEVTLGEWNEVRSQASARGYDIGRLMS